MSSYTFPGQLAAFHLMTHHRHPWWLSLGLYIQIKSFFNSCKMCPIIPTGGHLESSQALATINSCREHSHTRLIVSWGFVSAGWIYKVGQLGQVRGIWIPIQALRTCASLCGVRASLFPDTQVHTHVYTCTSQHQMLSVFTIFPILNGRCTSTKWADDIILM